MVKIISTDNNKTFNNKHMLKIFKAAAIKFRKVDTRETARVFSGFLCLQVFLKK